MKKCRFLNELKTDRYDSIIDCFCIVRMVDKNTNCLVLYDNISKNELLQKIYQTLENDDIFTFTITKYLEKELNKKNTSKKIIGLAKKNKTFNASSLIYEFNCFEDFCDFCNYIHNAKNMNINGLYKHSILYLYNSTYYLSIDDLNFSDQQSIAFHSSLLEFSSLAKYTKNFKFKLKEHGKVIMKNNAIRTGIRYFS